MKRLTLWVGFALLWHAMGAGASDVVLFPRKAELSGDIKSMQAKALRVGKVGATAEWDFEVSDAGDYHVFIEMSCVGWASGSKLSIWVDDQLAGTVKTANTKNTYKITRFNDAPLTLSPGTHRLTLRPETQRNNNYIGTVGLVRISQQASVTEMVDISYYQKQRSFGATLRQLQAEHPELIYPEFFKPIYHQLWADFPHQMSWVIQDAVDAEEGRTNPKIDVLRVANTLFDPAVAEALEPLLFTRALAELDAVAAAPFKAKQAAELKKPVAWRDWMSLYESVCKVRRARRLEPLLKKTDSIIFAKHQVFGSQTGIYNITETEGLNDGETSALCTVDLSSERSGTFAKTAVLLDAAGGILRDPELSYDAKLMLFAWRNSKKTVNTTWGTAPDTGNYQIYEMDLATHQIRQLTDDSTYGANYEACYLPDGNIIFNSARIVQHITCGWGDHSNLFLMDKDGKYQRRVGFDQVSTQFPTVLNNGQVTYLRRDYNDRAQSAAHALFVMNADGTGQTEYYGNQTGTPNSFMHARAIPGSDKVACVLSGYHTRQGGQLALIDIRQGRNHGKGIVQIPQGTPPPSDPGYDDGYLKAQVQYANPYPLSETDFIVSRSDVWDVSRVSSGIGEHFGLYFQTADNRRELLAYDANVSCLQPMPVMKRAVPPARPSVTDYTKDSGVYYVQNVYLGSASKGITNAVKKIRVVEVLYKHDTIHSGTAVGPGGGQDTVTPPAHPLALFDAKRIIGEATVYEDGSALFEAPARTPVYFQLLDEKNRCLQTMRSWTTLMPNERFSCVGCHEDKNETPVVNARTMAMSKGIEKLAPFYGEPRGFSFMKEVQPVFDKHCVSCHTADASGKPKHGIVLTAEPFVDVKHYGRSYAQSYVQLMAARPDPHPEEFKVNNGPPSWNRSGPAMADEPNKYVQYWGRLRRMAFKQPYFAGAIASGLTQKLDAGHQKVKLSQEEWDKIVAWIDLNCPYTGDYMESNIWEQKNVDRYSARIAERKRNEAMETEAINAFIQAGQP